MKDYEMKCKWREICKDQVQNGKDYLTRMKNIKRLYEEEIIKTNNQLVELLKERIREINDDLTIVRVEYYNVYGQVCDADALWLSVYPVRLTDRVSLYANNINGREKYDGIVRKIYQVPVSDKEFITVACPLNHRKFWSVEEIL